MSGRSFAPGITLGAALVFSAPVAGEPPVRSLPVRPAGAARALQGIAPPSSLPFEVAEVSLQGLAAGALIPPQRMNLPAQLRVKVRNPGDQPVASNATLRVRLLRQGAPEGQNLALDLPLQVTLAPGAFQVVSLPFTPADIPDLGFEAVPVSVRTAFDAVKAMDWGQTESAQPAVRLPAVPAAAGTRVKLPDREAPNPSRLQPLAWKSHPGLFRAAWPTPTLTSVSPEVGGPGETLTLTGSGFGPVQGSRRVVLSPPEGLPRAAQVLAWSDQTLRIAAPAGKGPHRIGLANASMTSLVSGPAVHLGARTTDLTLDLPGLLGGAGIFAHNLDPEERPGLGGLPWFYVGPKGGSPGWRSKSFQLPPALLGGAKGYVQQRAWSEKKNTYYDLTAQHFLGLSGEAQALSWEEDTLVITLPLRGQVKELLSYFFYNFDKAVPYEHTGSYVCATAQQTLTIRVRLEVQAGGAQGRHRLAVVGASCTPVTLAFAYAPQGGGTAHTRPFNDAWEATRPNLSRTVETHLLDPNLWTGVFGTDLTQAIERQLGPGRDVLRVVGRGGNRVTVSFQEP